MKKNQPLCEPSNVSSGNSTEDMSCVSMKSDQSMDDPINLRSEDPSADVRMKLNESEPSTEKELEDESISLMKTEPQRFKSLLSPENSECSEGEQQDKVDQTRKGHTTFCMIQHKSRLKEHFQRINEGLSNQGSSIHLHEIYTELYITEGGSGALNNEHEVRQIETTSWTAETQETPVNCNEIFKASPGQNKPIRTVLTKGVAGIGKTVAVQKFILDWAEGKDNQDVHLIFPLPFRELNLMKEKNISLVNLLHYLFSDTQELRPNDFDDHKVLFILDGLDECQFPLDFQNNSILCDVTESSSVEVLLNNLIKGNLLPSALLWITSRPAAASQIPLDCVDQVTEVRGFNDPQKDEYFRKRINDQNLANRVVTHIKSSRSLYIMCHIPVFCWISATVLVKMLSEAESAEIPKTLTQMYTHFLVFQTKLKAQKYDRKYEVDLQQANNIILALGKLAFQQLEKGNLIFYEEDLIECGIDVREVSVYSGVCTQIFRKEYGPYLGRVYSFVHLSFQEFLAALFKIFIQYQSVKCRITDLLKNEVDRALQSENGHWDLYLRFLLGLSLESNQTLLGDILTLTERRSDNEEEIVEYIKIKIKDNPSPEKCINLIHCLNELKDHTVVEEVQKYLSRIEVIPLSRIRLSPAQWSALVFLLLNSEEKLNEFKLSKYKPSEEGLLRLLPVVKASRKSDLQGCKLTENSCSPLASVLSSNSSSLIELNLGNNSLQDSGVKLLSVGLENSQCKLQALILQNCVIGEEGCAALTSALKSNPSHLKELDLSWNKPGDLGGKLISDLLKDPECVLEKLLLCNCSIGEKGCSALVSSLMSNPSHLRELNLSYNTPGDSAVKLLSDLLKNQQCKLEKLHLCSCSIEEDGCAALASALKSNPSHLRELNLNYNKPGDSGIKLLSELLQDLHCKLGKLQLCDCSINEKSCKALVSGVRSNPSHLRELSLNNNELGDSGVKLLSGLLQDTQCKLEKLQLKCCRFQEEGFAALISALRSNPSHLRELNLDNNKPGDSGVKLLSDLLKDPQCKLEKLQLSYCSIGEEGCAALASALRSNPSHLRELNMNHNELEDAGVRLLSDLLKDSECKLEKLHIGRQLL